MRLHDYVRLARLVRARGASVDDYRDLQSFLATLAIRRLERFAGRVAGQRWLDLGCGRGGYARAFAEAGARVIALDLDPEQATGAGADLALVQGKAEHLPFGGGHFDVVVCASLIEHVRDQSAVLAEIVRVLRPGGWCYLSYPPFYSPRGGHQFSPFHLLGERAALLAYGMLHRDAPAKSGFAEAFDGYGLTPTTIRAVRAMLASLPVVVHDVSPRLVPVNVAGWPVVGELLTWHVQFVFQTRTE
ncbi:MAG: class I SAM-dependent methyltransferase [Chloroflexi bacterium]|nr:class I SAM-dependent methyltransferase [Chloroflexota bacterium]